MAGTSDLPHRAGTAATALSLDALHLNSQNKPRPGQITQPVLPRSKHLPELDALRGLAAFVVLLNHFYAVWLRTGHPSWLDHPMHKPPLWLLVDGHASVILFFLLSGFVLSLPRLHGSRPSYPVYVLRRVCRIYLPYLAALFVSVAACGLFFHYRLDGRFMPECWRQPPDAHSLLQHVAMLGRLDVYRYDGPIWSLVHEMRISLVFPLIVFCALRLRVASTVVAAAACTFLASVSLARLENNLSDEVHTMAWSYTLSFCGIFLLGAGLARHYDAYTRAIDRLHVSLRTALFFGAMLVYLYPVPPWHSINMGDFSIACGGLVLLTFALRQHGLVARLLRLQAMQFLGTISYSLYLLHFPILTLMSPLAAARFSFGWLLVPFLAASILAAVVMYHLVEMPSMRLGRRVRDLHFPARIDFAVGLRRTPQS